MSEPLAIVGISCRVPGADDVRILWQLLVDGRETVAEVPASRWPVPREEASPDGWIPRRGGFLADVRGFDTEFFGVSAREAIDMDPQQRLSLELAVEALEDAAIAPSRLRGSETGVFVGVKFNDYEILKSRLEPDATTPFTSTGNVDGLVANRVSHFLGLQGPSMVVNASCAGSLVAVHLGCRALLGGECDAVLVGGVQLNLLPETGLALSKMGVLAADGRCKTFDAAADGYVRSEGGAMVVIKPLSAALSDGNRVYAVIRGSATNNNGVNDSLPAVSRDGQQRLVATACRRAAVEPHAVHYVECHGSGTAMGDSVELAALGASYGAAPERTGPLAVGSIKTNLGHLEAAAGIVGLVKVALSLHHATLVPSLHFRQPPQGTDHRALNVEVVDTTRPWPAAADGSRHGAVSAFGFGGSNAHVVLGSAPEPVEPSSAGWRPAVVPLSAMGPEALQQGVARWHVALRQRPELDVRDVAHIAGVGRDHGRHRLAVVAGSTEELADALQRTLEGGSSPGVWRGEVPEEPPPGPVFVYGGQGGQWVGMGQRLLQASAAFRDAVAACDEAMAPELGHGVTELLAGTGPGAALDRSDRIQPALFAFQLGLTALLDTFGIRPAVVLGHSMGEVAAAVTAGALTLREGAQVICRRSRVARERAGGRGAMALVELGPEQIREVLQQTEGCSLAAVNSPRSVVVSGQPEAIEALLQQLQQRDVFCRQVKVEYASHGPQMDPLLDELTDALSEVRGAPPRWLWVSTVTGQLVQRAPDAAYWAKNLRQTVRFHDGVCAARAMGHGTFVEIGPHPVLVPALQEGVADGAVLATVQRDSDPLADIGATVAGAYVLGHDPSWRTLAPAGRVVSLPTYAFHRRPYWVHQDAPPSPTRPPKEAESAPSTWRDDVLGLSERQRQGAMEQRLTEEVAAVLGIDSARVSPTVNFDRLAMKSRAAMELRRRLETNLAIRLSSAAVLGHPTVRKLAAYLCQRIH
ncbi:MAG: acyltransferase domain-containing protein [Myxococcales bacterium]|nr:acyltransferase domain-containing protein [Myxococcales bacterium]